ncbi:hypothetical protein BCR44DRAFT_124050 [Catenaria anguillulae PL171]|uniref:Peptidase S54 rhomboid domain-containing protein n=1 Tax=Catenaria anguillulae PL171 TaxID=765915 RepID=A0A1Y2I0Y1_9FUNG|nr:hypothetical protein BCR44DRAFT_124050 [Catenaria anguillulae PL171]
MFLLGTTLTSFGVAVAIYDYNQVRSVGIASSIRDLWQRRIAQTQNRKLELVRSIADWPAWVPIDVRKAATMVVNRWYNLHEGQRTAVALMALNGLVFAAWQLRTARVQNFMYRWFTHHPLSGRSVTLLTSMFSHQTALHFGLNMFGLWAFGTLLHHGLGSREEFLAFYLSAGVASGWASHMLTLRTIAHAAILPSLGASGALFACLGAVAIQRPDLHVGLVFVPGVDLPLKHAFPMMVGLDLLGVIRGWQMFDHLSHLGGSLYGLLYVAGAREVLWYGMMENYIRIKHGLAVKTGNKD